MTTTPTRTTVWMIVAATLALFLLLKENGNHVVVVSAASSRAAGSVAAPLLQRSFQNSRDEAVAGDENNHQDEDSSMRRKIKILVENAVGAITVEDHYWHNTAASRTTPQQAHPFGWRNVDASGSGTTGPSSTTAGDHTIPDTASSSPPSSSTAASSEDEETAAVGVKSHHSKKSNAVGDPDGEGSDSEDDDDDDDDDDEEWQELEEELLEEMESLMQQQQQQQQQQQLSSTTTTTTTPSENTENNDLTTTHQVEVEVEFVDEDNNKSDEIIDMDETTTTAAMAESTLGGEEASVTTAAAASATKSSLGSGGVGVRLGQRLVGRRRTHKSQSELQPEEELSSAESSSSSQSARLTSDEKKTATTPSLSVQEQQLLDAWLPHVFLPPSTAALDYLKSHARSMDGASKLRLDRRTLYAGLLMEWNRLQDASSSSSSNSNSNKSSNKKDTSSRASHRKFLEKSTSQALQAALALATQPKWRRSFTRPNGLRLYDSSRATTTTTTRNNNDRNIDSTAPTNHHRACTLAMQETIAMALAHSLGAGFVILDDAGLAAVKQDLLARGFDEDDVKSSALIQSLLDLAREGKVEMYTSGSSSSNVARISECMDREIHNGLEDPFDDRAATSCLEMTEWEEQWLADDASNGQGESNSASSSNNAKTGPLPLVLFLRSQSAKGLLKSKSGVELLLGECNSSEGINLIVLGKGIDANTETLPQDAAADLAEPQLQRSGPGSRQMNSGAPFFDFAPNNQNASGQNDPAGSRRFNIFLARTTDAEGSPGILGAVAPPQAGNLFPHMMAMQARERLQRQQQQQQNQQSGGGTGDESPIKAELERWAQNLQQQMQTDGGEPLPPPQFFNASLSTSTESGTTTTSTPYGTSSLPNGMQPPPTPPPEVIKETLQQAMSELLDRLADMNEENSNSDGPSLSPDLHKAFAQVLRNENLRKGIAENLARAAPALTDPKCQGVMLSVYVPPMTQQLQQLQQQQENQRPAFVLPPPTSQPQEQQQEPSKSSRSKSHQQMNGWFQRMLNHQEEQEKSRNEESDGSTSDQEREHAKQRRVRTMAAAAAVMAADNAQAKNETEKLEDKAERNLARLESLCRPVVVQTPSDPVRAKSWEAWISRERGAVVFRQNRRALNERLQHHVLSLQVHTGTRGAGSSLRGMLSVRDLSDEMDGVIKCAIELEAARSQLHHESPEESLAREAALDIDVTLSQLFEHGGALEDSSEPTYSLSLGGTASKVEEEKSTTQYLHPSSLETALSMVSRISPCPSGGMFLASTVASHRSREEIAALAQDKHERALISQVVSPQDIGVTYDMIGGLFNVKELLRQSITYPLKFPHLYSEGIAREAVKGVLLFGPPGTGKTMLAKAVATEGGASFLSVDASSVENKWLGESEKNAKAVFTLARRLAPCVIFIDEVDSLLSSRDGTSDDSAHGTLTSVKTTMMSEWDGLNSGTNGAGEAGSDRVVVIGSTNRPFDLDEAVLRRFPRRILVDLPDLETREEILEVTLAENRLDPAVNLTEIAERLDGYTGSDIKEVCREAVVRISHEQARLLDMGFTNSREEDVTQGSLQRLRPVTDEDFEIALSKLKRSVSEKGRELARVWEWNDEYGEIKKDKKNHLPHLANMYL